MKRFFASLFGRPKNHTAVPATVPDVANPIMLDQVFSLQALPHKTYVDRSDRHQAIADLRASLLVRGKMVCIHGESKTGKTTFVREAAKRSGRECIRLKGPDIQDLESFWRTMGEQLHVAINQVVNIVSGQTNSSTGTVGVSAEAWLPIGALQTSFELSRLRQLSLETSSQSQVLSSVKSTCCDVLRTAGIWVIVDDFHLSCRGKAPDFHSAERARHLRQSIFEDLKGLIDEADVKFVFISIPKEPIDVFANSSAFSADQQLAGRVSIEEFPNWDQDELIKIPLIGFGLLGLHPDPNVCRKIASSSLGSPLNCHQICHRLCVNVGVLSSKDAHDANKRIAMQQADKAVSDFVRGLTIYMNYVHAIKNAGDQGGIKRPVHGTPTIQININEAILLGLAKSYIMPKLGLKIETLKKRIDAIATNGWTEKMLRDRLAEMASVPLRITTTSSEEFSDSLNPLIFDAEGDKVFVVRPELTLVLGSIYGQTIKTIPVQQ